MIKDLIHFYVYSNIHISLASGFIVASSYSIKNDEFNWFYIMFITCGCFIIYNLHRIIGLSRIPNGLLKSRHLIFKEKRGILFTFIGLSIATGSYCFYHLPYAYYLPLLFPIFVSALYILPVVKAKRARDYSYVKIILISITWSLFCAIPLNDYSSTLLILYCLEKFFFIFGITLPFDNRDRDIDINSGLKTFANITTPKNAISTSLFFTLLSWVVMLSLSYLEFYSLGQSIALTIFYSITFLLIKRSLNKDEFYYIAYLDGTILLNGLFIILVQ